MDFALFLLLRGLLAAARLRLWWHAILCWNCKRHAEGTFTMCPKAGESWLDAISLKAELEQD